MGTIFLIIILALATYLFWAYNRLVKLRNLVREGWSGVDVQLKRRHDLVPRLVETVRGYAAHEQRTLEEVVEGRSRAVSASEQVEREAAENSLSRGVAQVVALAEDYPDIKANKNFLELQENLVEIEDELQYARRYYNGTVRNLNTFQQVFPNCLIAKRLGFSAAKFFDIELASERKAPNVSLSQP